MSEPRGKNIIQNVLTLKHIYQYYIKDIEETSKYHVDYKLFRAVCEDFNKELSNEILEGYFFKMPYRLGSLRIKKRKVDINNLKPDFGLFNDSDGQYKNKHLNSHSNNYYVRYYWTKRSETLIKNKSVYTYIPTRANKRQLAKLIKENPIDQINKYFE
jgi:hypothetical protein